MNLWQRYRTVTLACLLVLLSLVLLTLSAGRERDLSSPEKVALEILAPVQKVVMGAVDAVADIGRRYLFLIETAEENARLRSDLSKLRQEMVLYQEAHLANQRLRKLLGFKERTDLPLAAAEVVGLDPSGWFNTVILDKGESDGVLRGMAVVNADGVVGRIVEVGYHYSKVLLIIDRNSAVDALIQRSRARGILSGGPDGRCRLEFVLRNADVKEGDLVITSGLTGAFPKGMILGRVASLERDDDGQGMFQRVNVQPAVDFDRLEEVLVVLKPNTLFSELSGGGKR